MLGSCMCHKPRMAARAITRASAPPSDRAGIRRARCRPGTDPRPLIVGRRIAAASNTLAGWNSDIPRLRDDVYGLHLTPLLFFTLNLRGRLQGISNGFGACVFLSPHTSENADLSRRTGSPKRRINRHRYLPHPRTRL